MKSFPNRLSGRWLPLIVLACSLGWLPAQTDDAVPPVEPAPPAEPAAEEEFIRELPPQFHWRRGGPAVGVMNDIEIAEGETVEQVVSVLGNYVLRGRSRGGAVVILGGGEILGPVEEDSVTVLGELKTEAPINGDVRIVLGKAYINSHVRGDLVAVLSEVEFGPNAVVDGERKFIGPQPTSHPDAVFNGPLMPFHLPGPRWLADYVRHGLIWGRIMVPGIAWCWYILGFFFAFRLIVVLLFPKVIETGATVLRERALRSFIVGLIAYILYLPAQALLAATGVGVIAIPFITVAMMIAAILGKIVVLRSLGGQLARQLGLPGLDTTMSGFILGSVLVAAIYMVPVLGGIVFLLIKPMALGAMLIVAVESFRRERPTPPQLPPAAKPSPPPQPPVIAKAAPTTTAGIATASSLHVSTPDRSAVAQPTTSAAPPSASAAPPPTGVPPVIEPEPTRTPPRLHELPVEEMLALPRVGFWPRLGATFLDLVLVSFVTAALLQAADFFPLIWIIYHVAMWSWRGTTLGGIVFSLRIIRLDGRAPDFTVALVRSLASCLSFVVAGLGFFWASWNPEKQSWHDLIAGTVIVKTPRSLPLI
jgi:uncharacterized RDD family membrane protein YckC